MTVSKLIVDKKRGKKRRGEKKSKSRVDNSVVYFSFSHISHNVYIANLVLKKARK